MISSTSCSSSSLRCSSATRRLRGSCATAASPGTRPGARRSPKSARSATWCCCATPFRPGFRTTERREQRHLRLPTATIRTQVSVPLRFADGYVTAARVFSFDGLVDGQENLAFGLGDRAAPTSGRRGPAPLVRPHSECLTGDVFGSQRCDCGPQLREAVERIAKSGGFLLYLRQEGRGIGLYAKLDAYALQDTGLDTYEANLALGHREDERSYLVAAQMLHALGVSRLVLLSNNPDKAEQLRRCGVTVAAQVPTGVHLSAVNGRYLATKARRGAHTFDVGLSSGVRPPTTDGRGATRPPVASRRR